MIRKKVLWLIQEAIKENPDDYMDPKTSPVTPDILEEKNTDIAAERKKAMKVAFE